MPIKNGDKYKRQYWNKVAPCIHTRNDILSSQNTVHPVDDRFLVSVSLLMMSIPQDFKWTEKNIEELNKLFRG
jgi:DNA (cytosine-5)-methyltransferase 1